MGIRKLRSITPAQRFRSVNDFVEVTKDKPEKSLLDSLKRTGGRNSRGKMTIRYRGGGHKKQYRIIDFKRNKDGIEGMVHSIEYDPCRTTRISLLHYKDGEKRYILAPKGLKVGDIVVSGDKNIAPEIGNCMPLREIPLGSQVHGVELLPGRGAKLARSAGSSVQLSNKDGKYAIVKLPSGETRMIPIDSRATIGSLSNPEHNLIKHGKAGKKRWLGRRPRTRGVAMNPVDHPMGGGEGKASGGHPRSRNGIPAKGFKTRKKKYSDKFIIERRKK